MGCSLLRGYLRLALVVFACCNALCREIPMDTQALYQLTAADIQARREHSWANNPLYANPWVQRNIAITYAHKTRDGVGAQTMRLLGLYAVAQSVNLRYLHRPIQCVGHVDGKVHFRGSDCGYLSENDQRLMNKIRHMVTLPSDITEAEVQNWNNVYIEYVGWIRLAKNIKDAYLLRRPTLLTIEFPTYLVQQHPDMYFSVPAFRPEQPSARLVCRAAQAEDRALTPGRSWLLNALRIAVHFRRGDIAEDQRWRDRMLPPSYYVNVVKKVAEVMDEVGCDFAVELYTETPSTPEGEGELLYLKQNLPAAVMLISTDLAWSWQMMATADVLIMSNSAFSLSAAIMNPNALNIFFPNAKKKQARIELEHWFTPTDVLGTLPQDALDALRTRLLLFRNVTESEISQAQYNLSRVEHASSLHPVSSSSYKAVQKALTPVPAAAAAASSAPTSNSPSAPVHSNSDSHWQSSSSASIQQAQQTTAVNAAMPLTDTATATAATTTAPTPVAAAEWDQAPDVAPAWQEQELLDEDASEDHVNYDVGIAQTPQSVAGPLPGAVMPFTATAASIGTASVEQAAIR